MNNIKKLLTNGLDVETKEKKKKEEVDLPKGKYPFWIELMIEVALLLFVGFATYAFISLHVFKIIPDDFKTFAYSEGKEFRYSVSLLKAVIPLSFISSVLMFGSLYLFRPSGIKPTMGKKGKLLISLIILGLFGCLAFFVIALFLNGLNVSPEKSVLLASIITSIYDILIYKLDAEQRTYSNHLFWEMFRFAIVGLVAAVFDFATCFLIQFVAFKGNTNGYVTIIATAGGFTIGVIINYLMSTYMVYKASKSGFSKTGKGKFLFLFLSVVGLLLGMGLQWVLYDFLFMSKGVSFFTYPIDFVIRTLIVMVYNYASRKFLIYRK